LHKHGKALDALCIAWDDNANTMWRFSECLKMLGLNVLAIKGKRHPFDYEHQAPVHPSLATTPVDLAPVTVLAPGLESMIHEAHVVHLFACTFPIVPTVDWKKVNVVVQHGSSNYRQYPEKCNRIFNTFARATVIQCPDLLGLGAKNEHLIYYPVDTDRIQPEYAPSDIQGRVTIGHFPSNPAVKGTETVLGVLHNLEADPKYKDRFVYLGQQHPQKPAVIPWRLNIARMQICDIVIETVNPEQNGKRFGEWGNTALEAAAAGCAVVTNCHSLDTYGREYGTLGIHVANDAYQLEERLKALLNMTPKALAVRKMASRQWAVGKHSMQATAERLWDKVYQNFF